MKQHKRIPGKHYSYTNPDSSVLPDDIGPTNKIKKFQLLMGWLIGIGVFGVYAATGSPTLISCGDSAELTAAAASFGVAHAPGYPLFTLLGGLAATLTPHSPAHGVNLFNAFCAAAAVVCLFFLLLRLTSQTLASAAGALTLAFSYHFWLYAHVPEISALNAFFVGLVLLFMLRLPDTLGPTTPYIQKLRPLAFVAGLGFSHHHSIVFLMPGVALYVMLWMRKNSVKISIKSLGILLFWFSLGLTPYLYVAIRAHAMPYMNAGTVTTLSRFIDHFSRRAYGTTSLTPEYTPFNNMAIDSAIPFFGGSLADSFSWVGVGMGVLGFGFLLWRSPRIFAVVGLSWLLAGPFFVAWAGMPATSVVLKTILERFFIGSFFLFAVGVGVGLARVNEKISRAFAGSAWPGWIKFSLLGAVFLLPAGLLAKNWARLDFSSFTLCETYGRDLLASLPKNALVFVNGDNSLFTLWYMQAVKKERPDLKILNADQSDPYADHLRAHFPELGLEPRVTPTLKEILETNEGRFPLCVIGIPGTEFESLGLMGNPFVLRPSGLAFEVTRSTAPAAPSPDPAWAFQNPPPLTPNTPFFVEEIYYLYTIGHYNRAIIHATRKENYSAQKAAQMALDVDPTFAPAQKLRDRLALSWTPRLSDPDSHR